MKRPAALCLFAIVAKSAHGFTGSPLPSPLLQIRSIGFTKNPVRNRTPFDATTFVSPSKSIDHNSRMHMSKGDGDGFGEAFTPLILVAIIVLFVGSGIAPMLNSGPSGGGSDLNLGDAVVTRNADTETGSSKEMLLKNYESKWDRLSRAKIQEKLNHIPVFYLSDKGGNLGESIYLSYDDAVSAKGGSEDVQVKCTTLDQVMYPLVLKRGRMKMAPPPAEVQKAEESLISEEGGGSDTFKLVPSSTARRDADAMKLDLAEGDVPLFVADRLAFSGKDGPQVPLFLEAEDCKSTYSRLIESSGKSSTLPPTPKIRVTTLLDELNSMERGTRPAVSQLQFYATVNDLLKASEMI